MFNNKIMNWTIIITLSLAVTIAVFLLFQIGIAMYALVVYLLKRKDKNDNETILHNPEDDPPLPPAAPNGGLG